MIAQHTVLVVSYEHPTSTVREPQIQHVVNVAFPDDKNMFFLFNTVLNSMGTVLAGKATYADVALATHPLSIFRAFLC